MHEMLEKLETHRREFETAIQAVEDERALEELRVTYLGRKGLIATLFKEIGSLPNEVKGTFGKQLNAFKESATEQVEKREMELGESSLIAQVDVTLPARGTFEGSYHPLKLVEREIKQIFLKMGFTIERGPEIEDVWHNFDALNTPDWHPSRDTSDSLYLADKPGWLLRTETSPIQIRVMQRDKPPIRVVGPGRVFRNDKPDATHSPMFTQVEGLYVDQGVTFADLKGTILEFYRHLLGRHIQTRFRPHFFPFTEPSAEVDVSCPFCGGKGCRVCKRSGWIEMGGSGMVDPNVFKAVGLDEKLYSGWAFGLGIERLALMLYGVEDIRHFFENDIRFLAQFGGHR